MLKKVKCLKRRKSYGDAAIAYTREGDTAPELCPQRSPTSTFWSFYGKLLIVKLFTKAELLI